MLVGLQNVSFLATELVPGAVQNSTQLEYCAHSVIEFLSQFSGYQCECYKFYKN